MRRTQLTYRMQGLILDMLFAAFVAGFIWATLFYISELPSGLF